jgi:hypothetical protein
MTPVEFEETIQKSFDSFKDDFFKKLNNNFNTNIGEQDENN